MKQRTEILAQWGVRADSLLQTIASLIRTLEPQLPANLPVKVPMDVEGFTNAQKNTVVNLLSKLRDFADKQFQFFFRVFDARQTALPDRYFFDVSLFDIEYILRETAEQVGEDIELLARAFHQRAATNEMKEALVKADKLTFLALKPGVDSGLIAPYKALTYFTKSLRTRVIPYANVAIVGIPLTAMDEPRDLLGIPHEIGHVVYWHPKETDAGWRIAVEQDNPPPRLLWLEEIFADVYSCLVAGPAAVLTLIELSASKMSNEHYYHDGAHPPPPIRPDLQIATLLEMARLSYTGLNANDLSDLHRKFTYTAAELTQYWKDWQEESPKPASLFDELNEQKQEAIAVVKTIVENYLQKLNVVPWSTGIENPEPLSTLVDQAIQAANTLRVEDIQVQIVSELDSKFFVERNKILAGEINLTSKTAVELKKIVHEVFEAGGWKIGAGGPPRVSKG